MFLLSMSVIISFSFDLFVWWCLTPLSTIFQATQLLSCLSQISFEVDGKLILVNFAKNTFTTVMATLAAHYAGEQVM
jgi:hypothetical protein